VYPGRCSPRTPRDGVVIRVDLIDGELTGTDEHSPEA
jgi:hypothetical protein